MKKVCVSLMKSSKPSKPLSLSFEPAFQIMYLSAMSISFCLALIFATTIQAFNLYTILFLLIGFVLVYLKKKTHVLFDEEGFTCRYFRGYKEYTIRWDEIKEVDSYYPSRKIVIKEVHNRVSTLYLNQSNQRTMLEWIKEKNPSSVIHTKEL